MNKRRLALATLLFIGAATAVLFGAGEVLSRPATRTIGLPPIDFAAQTVRIPFGSEQSVVGWFAAGAPKNGAVLLLHGVRADRTQMLGRARALHQLGYTVLTIDLPAHGESTGQRITFGAKESAGVAAALAFLRDRAPGERIGVIGASLGAASTVLARIASPPQAVVLESMYPTIEEAVADRLAMRLGSVGPHLAPFLLWQLPARTGVSPSDLRPIEHIAMLGAPVLVVSGSEDQHTTWAETERLFRSARSPKELWRVEGAAHVDLYAYNPSEYGRRVFSFLAKHLRNEA
jgi:uncharacterized protein